MRKLLLVLVAIFLMASSAYAWVQTSTNGPENITTCYMIGTAAVTSGNVVVLTTPASKGQTGAGTVDFPGMEVTGTTTQGSAIYGVVVDSTSYTAPEMIGGRYIRVQTYGYCPIIKVGTNTAGGGGNIAAGDGISTGSILWQAAINGGTGGRVTGSAVAFEAATADVTTIKGFLTGSL